MYEIEYYEENDECPVLEFLKTLTAKEQAKILREIDLLEKNGFSLGMPYIKRMEGTDELWELRIKHSSNNFRVFFFHFVDGLFVLLHGIRKKSERTPRRHIDIAIERIRKYMERKQADNEA